MAPVGSGDLFARVAETHRPSHRQVHNSASNGRAGVYQPDIELDSGKVVSVTLQPATENEIADTVP